MSAPPSRHWDSGSDAGPPQVGNSKPLVGPAVQVVVVAYEVIVVTTWYPPQSARIGGAVSSAEQSAAPSAA